MLSFVLSLQEEVEGKGESKGGTMQEVRARMDELR